IPLLLFAVVKIVNKRLCLGLTLFKNSMRKLSVISMLLLVLSFSCAQGNEENKSEVTSTSEETKSVTSVDPNSPQEKFWQRLQEHCGKAYAGVYNGSGEVPEDFAGQELVMYVMECSDDVIKVPFHVGDNLSRTWVFTKTADGIELKHDHRLEDGSDDEVTMYGGTTSNTAMENIQFFPADQETADLIPYASGNVWWVTIDEEKYTYNLRRVTTPNHFSVAFDLTQEIPTPPRPWGH